MRFSKIQKASYNNRLKVLEIVAHRRSFSLPFSKLSLKPSPNNLIVDAYPDPEMGFRCLTYRLRDGRTDSVPIEAFLEYNRDPDYIYHLELYKLTIKAIRLVENSGLSKRAICRRMETSLSQLSRLLDTTNYQKSFDQMFKLITILGAKVNIKVA